MRQKTLTALAVVTVPVALAALLLPSSGGSTTRPPNAGPIFPSLKDWIGTAAKLTVTGPDGSVELDRKPPAAGEKATPADGWTLPGKGSYPVPAATIRPILNGLIALHAIEAKTERPKLYARLDLSDPGKGSQSHELELTDGNGASILKLIVGKTKYDPLGRGDQSVYVRKPDDAHTWLAQPALQIPGGVLDWIDRKIVDIDQAKIKDLSITPAGGKPLELGRDKAEDKLAVKNLPKDAKLKSDDPGAEVASGFRYLDLDDVEPASQATGTSAGTVHVTTFDGLTADFALTKQGDGTWVTVTAQGTGDAAKAADELNQRAKGWAFKLADARAATLETKLADLEETPPPAAPDAKAKPTK